MADIDPAAASLEGVSESGLSVQTGGSPRLTDVAPAAAAVPKLSGEFAGGSVAERVAERRRESATAKAGAAAVPQVEGVQVTESPAAPTEGLTLNFLATQLLVLQDKVKAQEVAQTESRQIMEAQRDEIEFTVTDRVGRGDRPFRPVGEVAVECDRGGGLGETRHDHRAQKAGGSGRDR